MLAMAIGLQAMRFAPASRVARIVCKDYAHDAWALRSELRNTLAQIRQADPRWFAEFVRTARRLNPELLRAIL
jgi:hypothetical protein